MAEAAMTLTGGRELDAALGQLGRAVATKVAKNALAKAARVIQTRAKANARGRVGGATGKAIAKSIAVQRLKNRRGMPAAVRLGLKKADNDRFVVTSKAGKRSYIPAAIEYGHDGVPANSFMRAAFDTTKNQAVHVITTEVRAGIQKETAKAKRR